MSGGVKERSWSGSRVVVLYGGESEEREVSLKTGEAFYRALKSLGYEAVSLLDATSLGLLSLAANPPDVALLALHGGLGENGSVQGLLECLQVPYTGSGVHACAVAMNKLTTKRLWRQAGVPTPDWETFSRSDVEAMLRQPSLNARVPCVVKPALSGSSVGITLVRHADEYYSALEEAHKCPGPLMLEALIEGRELTIGMMDGQVMGIVEITPAEGFYDYEAKYTAPTTRYQFPAQLPDKLQHALRRDAEAACEVIGARGVCRIDVMLDEDGRHWFLELNTTPGMTETSLVPKIAAGSGIDFARFTEMLLNKAKLDADAQFE